MKLSTWSPSPSSMHKVEKVHKRLKPPRKEGGFFYVLTSQSFDVYSSVVFELWIFIQHKMLIVFHLQLWIFKKVNQLLNPNFKRILLHRIIISAASNFLPLNNKKPRMLRRIFVHCFELWIFIHNKMLIELKFQSRIVSQQLWTKEILRFNLSSSRQQKNIHAATDIHPLLLSCGYLSTIKCSSSFIYKYGFLKK